MLPSTIAQQLESFLGLTTVPVTLLPSGAINHAARIETENRPLFVKWNLDAPARTFELEADGLNALRRTQTICVPETILIGDGLPFLVMEYLPDGPPRDSLEFARKLGEELATLHRVAPDMPRFGYHTDNLIGNFIQQNLPRANSWSDFYRDSRLLPQITLARQRNLLPSHRENLLIQLIDRLDSLLGEMPTDISLLHGDLWRGNLLCLPGDVPELIDPAVYHGPREMEIAYMELFGDFPEGFLNAYNATYPLDDGYPRRRTLHHVFPLLNHLNHFGESYGPGLDASIQSALT